MIGTSFGFVTVSLSFLDKEFSRGACSYAADGTKLPCPEGLGALLGTASVVAVVAIALAFTPPKILRRLYPPVVTGSTLLLMGVSLMSAAIVNWQGGSSCETSGSCLPTGSPDATYGSARMIGIGFLVWASIVVCFCHHTPETV